MLLHVRTRGSASLRTRQGVSPALTPHCHRLAFHASGGEHAPVDRPLRRAMLIIMRLSPPCVGIEVRAGLARLLDPPAAILRLYYRARTPVRLGPPVRSKTRRGEHRTKNVHRARRVSGGLLNPSGGARNRPRNKSVLAQRKNELNHNFAGGNKFRLNNFKKKRAVLDARRSAA